MEAQRDRVAWAHSHELAEQNVNLCLQSLFSLLRSGYLYLSRPSYHPSQAKVVSRLLLISTCCLLFLKTGTQHPHTSMLSPLSQCILPLLTCSRGKVVDDHIMQLTKWAINSQEWSEERERGLGLGCIFLTWFQNQACPQERLRPSSSAPLEDLALPAGGCGSQPQQTPGPGFQPTSQGSLGVVGGAALPHFLKSSSR